MAGTPATGGATQALSSGLNGGTPAAFVGSNYTAPAPVTFGEDLPAPQMPVGPDGQPLFDPNAPTGASPQGQLTQANPAPLGGDLGPQASYGTPAPQVQAPAVPPIQPQLPQAQVGMPASQVLADAAAPQATAPVGQLPQAAPAPLGGALGPQANPPPGLAPNSSFEGGNPDVPEPVLPQVRPSAALDPALLQDPKNAGILQLYDEAVMGGRTENAKVLLGILNAMRGR